MPTPSVDQLKRALAIKEQIASLEAELTSVLGGTAAPAAATAKRKYTKKAAAVVADAPKKRTMSAEGRARIIAAQKARWAKSKKEKKA